MRHQAGDAKPKAGKSSQHHPFPTDVLYKLAPAGKEAIDHWHKHNAQALQRDVELLQSQVDSLQTDVSTLKDQVAKLIKTP